MSERITVHERPPLTKGSGDRGLLRHSGLEHRPKRSPQQLGTPLSDLDQQVKLVEAFAADADHDFRTRQGYGSTECHVVPLDALERSVEKSFSGVGGLFGHTLAVNRLARETEQALRPHEGRHDRELFPALKSPARGADEQGKIEQLVENPCPGEPPTPTLLEDPTERRVAQRTPTSHGRPDHPHARL